MLHKIESKVEPLQSFHGEQVLIVDGMTYVQQAKFYNKGFGQFAMVLMMKILAAEKKNLVMWMFLLTITAMHQSKM